MDLEAPWMRPKKDDVALISEHTTTRWLHSLNDVDLARTLRDNLIPRHDTPRHRWHKFWDLVAMDPAMSDRVFQILETFADQAESAEPRDEAEGRRLRKFATYVDGALDRFEEREEAPLAWLGPKASRYNPEARKVIEQLINAIDDHRRNRDDEALYEVLRDLGFDPESR